MNTKFILTIFSLGFLWMLASCSSDNSDSPVSGETNGSGSNTNTGGSMARFTIVGNRLFLLSQNNLRTFDLSNGNIKEESNQLLNGWGDAETIFPYKNYIFIGSTNGMFIYDQASPEPNYISTYTHVVSCDPVVADSTFAYVTLRTGNTCQGQVNQLEVIDIKNLYNPVMKNFYPMTQPKGLAKKGNLLYVCDADNIKLMDATNPNALTSVYTHPIPAPYDIIPVQDWIIVSAKDGIYQMKYNGTDFTLLSKIH